MMFPSKPVPKDTFGDPSFAQIQKLLVSYGVTYTLKKRVLQNVLYIDDIHVSKRTISSFFVI